MLTKITKSLYVDMSKVTQFCSVKKSFLNEDDVIVIIYTLDGEEFSIIDKELEIFNGFCEAVSINLLSSGFPIEYVFK